jgi:hypothetical protein
MVLISDIKFYKSNNNGLGGGIDTSQQVTSGVSNNLFPIVTEAQRVAGATFYLCLYIKNTSTETAKSVQFWKSSGSAGDDTIMYWGRDSTGKNGTAPTIANINTAPNPVPTWRNVNDIQSLGDLAQNETFPLWFKSVVYPNTDIMRDNTDVFKFKFTNPSGGTGTDPDDSGGGGGTTGGTPTPSTIDWKIAVVGDWGNESMTDTVMEMTEKYNRVISVGDNAYDDEFSGWKSKADNHGLKGRLLGFAYGNHEYDDDIDDYKNWFGNSSTYFMKTFENVACITLDSNINCDSGSTQHNKFKEFLTTANNNSNIDWIFVTFHHPMFGSKSDHSYNDNEMVEATHDLMSDNQKCMFCFTGHNHNWQRSHKVKYNSGDPIDPTVTDSSSPFTNDTNGIIHVVSGTGGHDSGSKLYDLGTELGGTNNPNAFQNSNNNGIYELVASNNGKTLTCRFVATDGDTFDTITVTTT